MSCLLLDKMAPETRALIYKYALSFDTPLKHVTKMQPFVEKLTGVDCKADSSSTDSEVEAATRTASDGANRSLQRVNTSLLTASKLIYTEAIATFYKHNTIQVDAQQICNSGKLIAPRATDLSLAKHVISKMETISLDNADCGTDLGVAMTLAVIHIPNICPALRTSSVIFSVDAASDPEACLIAAAATLRAMEICNAVVFDRVGSLIASFDTHPCLRFVVQARGQMERWDAGAMDIVTTPISLFKISARTLYQRSRGKPQNASARSARMAYDIFRDCFLQKIAERMILMALSIGRSWTLAWLRRSVWRKPTALEPNI
jgi:hypothetical protein